MWDSPTSRRRSPRQGSAARGELATGGGRNEALEVGVGGWLDDAPEGRDGPDDALRPGDGPDNALELRSGRWLKDSVELASGR
jgi:hypothetical protein